MAPVGSFENVRIKDANVVKKSAPVWRRESQVFPLSDLSGSVLWKPDCSSAAFLGFYKNVEMDNFDDFGVELCPIFEATVSCSDLDVDKKLYFTNNEMIDGVSRCLEMPKVGCQKLQASELSEANPESPLGDKEETAHRMLTLVVDAFAKPDVMVIANPQAAQNVDLPAELKCSLCDTFFKEAVMIPCCQHSFCDQCIRLTLIQKGRCPKCLSTRCRVEDLLPNVSLRQAIKRFLESQILTKSSDNVCGYAPDVESGVQVKEMSCAVSIHQREAKLPGSICTNQIFEKAVGKSSVSHKLKQIDAEKHGLIHPVDLEREPEDFVSDFQGENQPIYEQAEITTKKKRASWVNTAGIERSFVETGRHRKGNRTCYMCGSPDHLIRDCPTASSPHPMLQTGNAVFPGPMQGYLSPYWNGIPFSQIRSFVNPYGNPFNAAMVPPSAFPVPTYMPCMMGSMAPYSGFTRMRGVPSPVGPRAEWHPGCSDFWELQGYEKKQKLSNNNLGRGQSSENCWDDRFGKRHYRNEAERSHDCKSGHDREDRGSHSRDIFNERPHWKHRHCNHSTDKLERSSSEVEDMPSSSSWHNDNWHKCHHRSSRKHDGGREQDAGNSSHSRHRSTKAKDVKRKKVESSAKREKQKYHSQSESGWEPSLSSDQKSLLKERDSSHGSRHSRHNSVSMNNEPSHERWQMACGSDDDEDYHYYKRKRLH